MHRTQSIWPLKPLPKMNRDRPGALETLPYSPRRGAFGALSLVLLEKVEIRLYKAVVPQKYCTYARAGNCEELL